MKNKLKVGVFIPNEKVPNWVYIMLKKIHDSEFAEIKTFFVLDESEQKERKEKNISRYFLFKKFIQIERKIFKNKYDPFRTKEISSFSIPKFAVSSNLENLYHQVASVDKKVSSLEIDVIVDLSNSKEFLDKLKFPKYGFWYYNFSEITGFWEVINNKPDTNCLLNIIHENYCGEQILFSSYSLTHPNSVSRNASVILWKASLFVPRKLKELYLYGDEQFFSKISVLNKYPRTNQERLYEIPHNFQLLFVLLRHYTKYLLNRIHQMFFREQWQLQYSINDTKDLSINLKTFTKIIPPKDKFWADPDFIKKDGNYYIFFEEYIYSKRKAHISYFVLDEKGKISPPKVVINKNYHLSFPFVFTVDDRVFMIPESSANRTIELYECKNFPDNWELVKVLMEDIVALDTNLFFHDNKWWLFTTIEEIEGASKNDDLFIFYTDDFINDKWVPHPLNPVVSDTKTARSAGHIFKYKNNLYRPSQNCSKRYGYGMNINQIIRLNENEYEEKLIEKIDPKWDKKYTGVHTLNHKDNFTIIDVSVKRNKYI